ncbi:MAG TPA: hypothetical protein PKA28_03300 [Methylomusa anaerophila]|uniref:Uncharacterized protein n=1 Tax=Methylomusa anaerophila TaxID=1930071 RepID=A0A348ANP7_9FIRM|nr:hypothetical protein [Methylomusa anaerophila]BBB92695.1 hypothetical protein MAMMFC1_03390 [Methylomusa anaerophila]HML87452.1 hypothetical protein [Methylomusa anaerophila]
MKAVFRERVSQFASLISLIALCAMLILFSLNLPGFLVSSTGRAFAGVWAVFALVVFWAHAMHLAAGHPSKGQLTGLDRRRGGTKEVRSRKNIRMVRAMRG